MAVTDHYWRRAAVLAGAWLGLIAAGLLAPAAMASTLPEDRADALYHSYDGGGVQVDGPSVLVRKDMLGKVSVHANYYVDLVSSASIDVVTRGSPYSEQRDEYTVGADYLVDKALLSVSYTNSKESDYVADTIGLGVSQTFFGDMTTLTLGYTHGSDEVYRNEPALPAGENGFEQWVERRKFSVGLTQVLTKDWLVALSAETSVDDGYLNNPYRQVRYLVDNGDGSQDVGWQPEHYPSTRNSDAVALRTLYYLPWRASLKLEARAFKDSWDIGAENFELRYLHTLSEDVWLEVKTRFYSQTEADFFSDIFPYFDSSGDEYRGRDKELSAFSEFNLGLGFTYQMRLNLPLSDRQSVGLYWDFMRYAYDNYRDTTLSQGENAPFAPGAEPTYSYEANVLRLIGSIYF